MIRHRPYGSGHPYSTDTEQRSPAVPEAGSAVTLGVRTGGPIASVSCELVWLGDDGVESVETLDLAPVARSSRGQTVDGGHLASAQARLARAVGGWQVVVPDVRAGGRYRYRFTALRDDTGVERTRWFTFRAAEWHEADAAITSIGTSRVVPGSVSVLHDGERAVRIRFSMPLGAAEHVTGLGERFDALDHRGEHVDSVVFEQYKNQGAERKTYLPMPFAHVVGGDGWGFHVQTSRRCWFDFGQSETGVIVVEAELDAAVEGHTVEGAAGFVDLIGVRFYNGDPTDVLRGFLDDVGSPRELPAWVFRLWASGNEWNTQAEVVRQMNLHRDHGIPVGSVVIEAWSDESTFTAFRDARYAVNADGAPHQLDDFDFAADGAWPDPKGMVDELHDRDIRVHLWQIPLIKMRPHPEGQTRADAEAAVRENALIRELAPDGSLRPYRNRGWWFPLGLMPDLTDERAARWWTDKRRYLVDEVGIDGFKTDGGEHAWGSDLVYLDGRRGDEKNNTFPVAYAKAYGDLLESAGKAPVTFSRAGFTGSQAHGAFWAGDENSTWQAFRWSMLAGLSAAASGIVYWGWDLAGFSGDVPDAELYLRAAAASTFVPIMQYHSEFNHHRLPSRDRTPWNIAERSDDPGVLDVFRVFAELRERLVPYLTEQAARTIATARPLMRPLYFDYPQLAGVWDAQPQWLLGDELLVAPVLEAGATTWPVLVPDGEWEDAWTGEVVTGPVTIDVETPIDRIPVFIRAGAAHGLRGVFGR